MDSDDENDLMAIRARNMSQINNMFGDVFSEAKKIIDEVREDLKLSPIKQSLKQKRKRRDDELFRFSGYIPTERRKSERLTNSKPKYSYADLDKLIGVEDDPKDQDFYVDLEEVIRSPPKRRIFTSRSALPPPNRPPSEISETELRNISTRSGNKTYSQNGTSCHQCRQKTVDTKTLCRSGRCVGVRGQFCGPCLKNRYGESAREALLDPKWACPPCRNLCNCSICRTRDGKRPTGILAPTVQQEGYSSVKDFLLNLAEKGILSKENNNNKIKKSSQDVDDVITSENTDGVVEALINSYVKKIQKQQTKYETTDEEEDAELLGFISGRPVYEDESNSECDVIGFVNDNHYFIIKNNILYQCLLK